MACDAIILARGGSKGIPKKNIIPIFGKPLIAWTIEAARQAPFIRDVIISTDSEEIADIAQAWGGVVNGLRPAEISTDLSPSEDALRHAIEQLCQADTPDTILFLQVTSPARRKSAFPDAYKFFEEGDYDSLFSAYPIRNFIWRNPKDPTPLYDPLNRKMRQNIGPEEQYYRETGNFYIFRTAGFLQSGSRLSGRIGLYETSEAELVEIDELEDIKVAEAMLAKLQQLEK